jgi:hypothetical protein
MNFILVLTLSVILVAIAMIGFAVKILIRKGGRFPNTHVSGNKYLKSQGISCAQTYDRIEQQKASKKINFSGLKVSSQ